MGGGEIWGLGALVTGASGGVIGGGGGFRFTGRLPCVASFLSSGFQGLALVQAWLLLAEKCESLHA